jgi:NADPH:quinone reductase
MTMTKAIRIHKTGGPEEMRWEDVEVPAPGKGEARVRHTAVGLNYVDTYQRSGLYPFPLPMVLGSEGAGVVEAVGPEVTDLKVGDRVAYGNAPPGAYAEARTLPAHRLVKLPAAISDKQAASMMLKGLTTWYLIRMTYPIKAGEKVLFHAAAGGVGLIFGQWAKHLGATVIGTVGSADKAKLAKAHGYDHIINYREQNFVEELKKLAPGGVPVVYDGVGKDTFMGSLDCLQPRGLLVSFGNASGAVPPVNLGILSTKGSLYVTRPTLATHVAKREDLVRGAGELFDVVSKGVVKIEVNQTYPLKDAAQAHRDLESRKTTGSTVFTV